MPNWDYFTFYLDPTESPSSVQDPLAELGSKGWELVAVAPYSSTDTGALLIAFFKRPLEEHSEGFVIT
jgi:hypothetical protein